MKKILTLIFALIAVVNTISAQDAEPDYLFFKCIDEKGGTISVQKTGYATFDMQYSRDKKTWTDFSNSVGIAKDGIVYFKGKNPNGINTLSKYIQFKVSVACECGGNIMTLIDGKGETTVIPSEQCFYALFKDCDKLTTAPKLPATTLRNYCYWYMFSGCKSLITVPELPATTLRDHCYRDMFSGCQSLITVPELPATTLASWCYELMFSGCTSLTTAPELPATALKPECYYEMFSGCTNLTTVPGLPATRLAEGCYYKMFKDCTSLTTAPDLPATKLTKECYQEMFDGCTSLIAAPELPATTLAESCYRGMFSRCTSLTATPDLPVTDLEKRCYAGMFSGCTSLTTAPKLPATTLAVYCYNGMFSGCTSLTAAPELPATKLAQYCYSGMFSGCTKLTTAPALPVTNFYVCDGCYYGMFSNCTGLTSAPELPATELAHNCYDSMFSGCTSLTVAPKLPATQLMPECYSSMFKNCTSLIAAPELPATGLLSGGCYQFMFSGCTALTTAPKLPAEKMNGDCYKGMFYNCTGLTTAPELPATELWKSCYEQMFSGCTGLSVAPKLPAAELKSRCYYGMFSGCTGLREAPELPATTLAGYCYQNMFKGCTNLNFVPGLPATTLAGYCYQNMFEGCTNLNIAPELPATTLAAGCYKSMFSGCLNLTLAPQLPATTLAAACYYCMFQDCSKLSSAPNVAATVLADSCCMRMFTMCTNLTQAPQLTTTKLKYKCYYEMFAGCASLNVAPALPATTLDAYCYDGMFQDCVNLTTAPELPATTLSEGCYMNMFKGCICLTNVPDLPATQLIRGCYNGMFYGCKKLDRLSVKFYNWLLAGAQAWSTGEWLYNVSEKGYFICNSSLKSNSNKKEGPDFIPSGWIILSRESAQTVFSISQYDENITTDKTSAMYDEVVNFTVKDRSNEGYLLDRVLVNNVEISVKNFKGSFKMVDFLKNISIQAWYSKINYLINCDGFSQSDKSTANIDDVIEVTFMQRTGYELVSATINGQPLKVNNYHSSFKMPAENVNLKAQYNKRTYTIVCDDYSSVEASGANMDDKIGVTFSKRDGYTLTSATFNGTALSISDYKSSFTMPAADVEIKTGYTPITYAVSCSDANITADKTTATIEAKVNITIKDRTSEGYKLDKVLVNSTEIVVQDFKASFDMKDYLKDVTITAQYSKIPYTITTDEYSQVANSTANMGDVVNVTFKQREGYNLTSATYNGKTLTVNNYKSSFTMPAANVEIKTVYAPIAYAISCSDANITADKTTATIEDKVNITIKDRTSEGYKLDKVLVNSTEIAVKDFKASFDMKDYLKDVTISAQYSKIPYTITTDEYSQVANTTATVDDAITVTFKQREGYDLTSATCNGNPLNIKDYKATFTMPAQDVEIKAVYTEKVYEIEKPSEGVSVSQPSAKAGDEITISVNPKDGYTVHLYVNGAEVALSGNSAVYIMPSGKIEITVKYVVEEKTPVSEIELDNCAVSVFPNPAKSGEEITFKVGGKFDMNNAKIYLYNASGSLVMQIDNVKEYNQLTLRSGVYVGVLVTKGGTKTFRVAVK